uniref:Peptidase S1 domain-containing protein n=1 Tax=Schistocephalus solidus TaxID=70667 RepID=A0A0V0J240_SCHSO
MKGWLAVVPLSILFSVSTKALDVEFGFPTDCGVPAIPRVYNEAAETQKTLATPKSYPWHVGLWSYRTGDYPFCGGTLISQSLVITAAHCIGIHYGCDEFPVGELFTVAPVSGHLLQVQVGAYDYTKFESNMYFHTVASAIVHPQYKEHDTGAGYDIAILKLDMDVTQDAGVQPICFPSAKNLPLRTGSGCYFSGWGLYYTTASITKKLHARKLREAQVEMDFDENCNEMFSNYNPDRQSCIRTEGRSPCQGDSGGGIFCPSNDGITWFWNGVIESSREDCRGSHTIISNIKTMHPWIKATAFNLGL